MARRSGLGRGFEALIPNDLLSDRGSALPGDGGSALLEVPINSIRPNPHQPRSHFDEEDLSSLTASIRAVGVLQPVLLRSTAEGHVRADRRGTAVAGCPAGRAAHHSRPGAHRRRAGQRRAGPDREPAPGRPQPHGRGGRLSTTDRGFRPDPRADGHPGRSEPSRHLQHPAAVPAASEHPAPGHRGPALGGPRPSPAGHPRPELPGGAGPPGGGRGSLGAGGRGRGAPADRAGRPPPGLRPGWAGCGRRAWWSWRISSPSTWTRG